MESKTCANPKCGIDFIPGRANQLYHSEPCRKKRHRSRSYRRRIAKPERRLSEYKRGANKRGHEWALTDEQAYKLFSEPCFYCGDPGGGIDRFDNSQGYTAENSVPCCKTHNFMKGTMDGEEFIAQAMKITRHTVGVVELFLSRKDVSNVQG